MYGMYVDNIAVAYVTFPNNWDLYQSWSDRSTKGIVKYVYIIAVCTYNACD